MPGGFFYRLAHLVVAVEVEHIGYQVQRILVVLDLRVQTRQVEAVCQVLLVNLAKVLVAAGRDELVQGRALVDGKHTMARSGSAPDVPNPANSWCSRSRTRSHNLPWFRLGYCNLNPSLHLGLGLVWVGCCWLIALKCRNAENGVEGPIVEMVSGMAGPSMIRLETTAGEKQASSACDMGGWRMGWSAWSAWPAAMLMDICRLHKHAQRRREMLPWWGMPCDPPSVWLTKTLEGLRTVHRFMALHAVFAALLTRYVGNTAICVTRWCFFAAREETQETYSIHAGFD